MSYDYHTIHRLPWQEQQWQTIDTVQKKNRLPHALLLNGPQGLGKKQFAYALAAEALCQKGQQGQKKQETACGACHACHLVLAGTHPDLLVVQPLESNIIKIDQIRDVVSALHETSMQGGWRVVLIHPASAMNAYAANALLKALEEPAPRTLIILINEQRGALLATIQSRCLSLLFTPPAEVEALSWLESKGVHKSKEEWRLLLNLTEGAPVLAYEWANGERFNIRTQVLTGLQALYLSNADPLELANGWQTFDTVFIFHLIFYWLRDILRYQLTQAPALLANLDFGAAITEIAQKMARQDVLHYLDEVKRHYLGLMNLPNLNKLLLLEELLIRWASYGLH